MSADRFLVTAMLFLFFVSSSEARVLLASSVSSPRNHLHLYQFNRQRHSCGFFPYRTSNSLCIHLQRMNQQRRLRATPTPPSTQLVVRPRSPLGDHEIDPRYGVEKRLVPSGPNPLHN
ncbi:hypothetical protein K2173_017101 [Erythroxylum novogranatense]|uniref:CLAVATA3/ESR (CLE)-related protein 9 n=1 Tax=Erythroxylum novogranatense TaxID=1862640 RepID=A0AAV8U5U3_9ROSI|nr:hypothetical protein K2173_017101 [Erythroxylum novogranatense]